MAVTLAYDADAPGRGGSGAVLHVMGSTRRKVVSGLLTFDSSYPTGGEDVSEIASFFRGGVADAIVFEQLSNRIVTYDKSAKKALLYTALSTEAANASNQSTIAVRFIAIGPA